MASLARLEGHGKPSEYLYGEPGQLYLDLDTNNEWECAGELGCISVNGDNFTNRVKWKKLSNNNTGGSSGINLDIVPYAEYKDGVILPLTTFYRGDDLSFSFDGTFIRGSSCIVTINGKSYTLNYEEDGAMVYDNEEEGIGFGLFKDEGSNICELNIWNGEGFSFSDTLRMSVSGPYIKANRIDNHSLPLGYPYDYKYWVNIGKDIQTYGRESALSDGDEFILTPYNRYKVIRNGVEYITTAYQGDNPTVTWIGNGSYIGRVDNGVPFFISYDTRNDTVMVVHLDGIYYPFTIDEEQTVVNKMNQMYLPELSLSVIDGLVYILMDGEPVGEGLDLTNLATPK